jgi:hypothetical protein
MAWLAERYQSLDGSGLKPTITDRTKPLIHMDQGLCL